MSLRGESFMCLMKWAHAIPSPLGALCGQNPGHYCKKPHVKARTKDIILSYQENNKRCYIIQSRVILEAKDSFK